MAWNDPGDNDRDPWGGRKRDQGPPDLDEVVKKMQDKLRGLFGRRSTKPLSGDGQRIPWMIIVVGLLLLLVYESFWRIEPAERGVVMRFGKYVTTLVPGPHFRFPRPIEDVVKINVDQIRPFTVQASMLTGDENIVDVEIAVQYRINEVTDYLFKVTDPDTTIERVAESAIRDIIGQKTLDFVITEGRAENAAEAKELIQRIMNDYGSGLEVTSVNMQPVKPPEEVKAAFDDAIKAREDEQRKINEAEAYRNEVVERMQGEGARIRLEAEGYKEQVIARSTGEARRFEQLLAEYEKAPAVTRRRLYLETVEDVLSGASKVMIDSESGNSLMYLPIDKLIDRQPDKSARPTLRELVPEGGGFDASDDSAGRDRFTKRSRGAR
jgi:membrane protease subunit HflK